MGTRTGEALDPVLRQGFVGVGFFFVLSGFVLTWSAPDDDRTWHFLRRRFARIYPAYVVAWIAAAAVGQRPGMVGLPSFVLVQARFRSARVHFATFAVGWTWSNGPGSAACRPPTPAR